MHILNVDMSDLYKAENNSLGNQSLSHKTLEVEVDKSCPPLLEKELVVLHDDTLRLGTKARVINLSDDSRATFLIKMQDVYSLDDDSVSGVKSTVSSRKKVIANGATAFILSAIYFIALTKVDGLIESFLILNSPVGPLIALSSEYSQQAAYMKGLSWMIVLLPFFGVLLCWKHWDLHGDRFSGWMGTVATSITAGYSTLLLFAVLVFNGFFPITTDSALVNSNSPSTSVSEPTDLQTEMLIMWLVASSIWLFVMLTGAKPRKSRAHRDTI